AATTDSYSLSLHDALPSHVDQLVLVAVVVAHGRLLARRQGGEVDADAGEAERVAERALLARQDAGPERLRIAGADPRLQRGGIRSEEHTSELQSRENLVC